MNVTFVVGYFEGSIDPDGKMDEPIVESVDVPESRLNNVQSYVCMELEIEPSQIVLCIPFASYNDLHKKVCKV